MNIPAVAAISMWRNDAERDIAKRVTHLLDKSYPRLSYIWVVGDSTDETENILYDLTTHDPRVYIVHYDTGIEGDEPDTRVLRMGQTFNAGLDAIRATDQILVCHESDLVSPVDIIQRLLAIPGDVTAGWPMLGDLFYDTFAYRKDGQMFSNYPPYHPCYRPDKPFEVDSVGSLWAAPSGVFLGPHGLRCYKGAVVDLMRNMKGLGMKVMVDPTLKIVQPVALWRSYRHADI